MVVASVFWQGYFRLLLDNESEIENSGMCKFLVFYALSVGLWSMSEAYSGAEFELFTNFDFS